MEFKDMTREELLVEVEKLTLALEEANRQILDYEDMEAENYGKNEYIEELELKLA